MSISVTVSGDSATQVTQSSAENQSVIISGVAGNQITASPVSSSTVQITESPGVSTDFTTNFAPALTAQSAALASFEARVLNFSGTVLDQLNGITGATGILNTAVSSNDSDITAIQTSTGVSDQKINTLSGDLNSLRGIAGNTQSFVALASSNATSINTLSASNNLLVTKTDSISGFITGSGSVLDRLSGINNLTGSFAITGSNVTFGDVTVSGDLLPSNANASLGNPSNRFRDVHLSSNSIFLGNSKISFDGAPSGVSGGLRVLAAGMSGRLLENTETGAFAATGSDVTFKNILVSESILPENTGASLGSPTGKFKDLHLSENSIFLGDSKISFSGGASGGLTITGSGLLTTGGQPKVIKLIGEDDEGRMSVQNSLEIGRNIFLGDEINESKIKMQGPGPVNYSFVTHANGFRLNDGDGGAGTLISVPHPFYNNDGTRNTMALTDTSVQGQFFTSSGVQHFGDGGTALHFPSSNILSLRTSGLERLRVQPNGDVFVQKDFESFNAKVNRGFTADAGRTAIGFFNGTSTVTNIGAADGLRSSLVLSTNTYLNVPCSGGAGAGATFNVSLDTSGAATVNVLDPGTGYSIGETLTISDSDLGGGGAADLTFDVETLTVTNGINTQSLHVANNISVSGSIAVTGGITSPSITSLNTATGVLSTATGVLVQKSETGVLLTSGEIQTNIDTAVSNLVDSAPATLNTLNELASALGDDANFATTTATSLGNLSTATGVLQGVTGSFAQTGLDVNFSNIQVGSTPTYSQTRAIKLHDNGVQFGSRISLIATNDDGGPGLEMVTDGNSSKRTLIRHEGEGSNDYGLSFFTTNSNTVSEKVRFDGNGNVGIGTTLPQAKLHVSGDAVVSESLVVTDQIKIGTGVAIGPLHVFNTGLTDTTVARFENSDTSSSDHDANVQIIAKGGGEASIHLLNPDNSHSNGYQIGHGDAFSEAVFFHNKHDSRTDMVIDQAGNVGIGTTSTTRRLAINSSAASNLVIVSPTNNLSHIGLGDTDDDNYAQILLDNSVNKLQIQNGGGAAISDRGITLDSSENVGIGTQTPSAALHVAGTTLLSGDVSVTGSILSTGTITSTSTVARPVQNDETDSTPIRNIRNITNAAYTGLTGSSGEDANTLYIIVG